VWRYLQGFKGGLAAVADTTKGCTVTFDYMPPFAYNDEQGGHRWALNILTFIGILIATWIVSGIFSRLIHQGMKRVPGTSRLLEDFFVRTARWIVLAIGLIMALGALEVSVGPLLAVVGAAGFAVAFALQDSLSNFANGLMILFFRPFDVGHFIDAGGVSGKVESLNLVSTTIKTLDNRLVVVPVPSPFLPSIAETNLWRSWFPGSVIPAQVKITERSLLTYDL
jgi:hypothetical protein